MRPVLSLLLLIAVTAGAQEPVLQPELQNPGFEAGMEAGVPTGWRFPDAYAQAGYVLAEEAENAAEGASYISLFRQPGDAYAIPVGVVTQLLDPEAYRGQRIRLRVAVRAASGSRAGLMLRVDGAGDEVRFFDTLQSRPVTSAMWKTAELVGEVAADAERIVVALMLYGDGQGFYDDVRFEALGPAGAGNEAPRSLGKRGLANLVAFSKLLGYVRYFHPSDQAANADWERFAIGAMPSVERAQSPGELAAVLRLHFAPLAPAVQIFPSASPPPAPTLPEASRAVGWVHHGVAGNRPQPMYSSERVYEQQNVLLPLRKKDNLDGLDTPFEAELGGGVSCRVPQVLPADDEGTLPRPTASAPASPKPEGFVPSAADRTTRLAAVALAWNVFQHFYPYFDVVADDWPGALERALREAAEDEDAAAFLRTLRTLVATLDDGHGGVAGPGMSGAAVLPFTWAWIEDRLVVTAVDAERAPEIAVGDVVKSIDGQPVAAAIADIESFTSAATSSRRRQVAVDELLRGDEGEVRLEVVSEAGATPRQVALTRRRPQQGEATPRESHPQPAAELVPGVRYLDLDGLDEKTWQAVLPELAAAKGVVLDLRGYPGPATLSTLGHLTAKPLDSAQWHVARVRRPDRTDFDFERSGWSVEPKSPRLPPHVAFITDSRAISAAETYLGIVAHYGLGEIVGATTAATNGNINTFTLPGGYSVVWTGMKVLKHDGSQHHAIGIRPTVLVARTIARVRAGRDELLERAVKLVEEKIAADGG